MKSSVKDRATIDTRLTFVYEYLYNIQDLQAQMHYWDQLQYLYGMGITTVVRTQSVTLRQENNIIKATSSQFLSKIIVNLEKRLETRKDTITALQSKNPNT